MFPEYLARAYDILLEHYTKMDKDSDTQLVWAIEQALSVMYERIESED